MFQVSIQALESLNNLDFFLANSNLIVSYINFNCMEITSNRLILLHSNMKVNL